MLPLLPFDVGPNNLFRVFKESIPIAYELNYTLTMPIFHQHPRMEKFVTGTNNTENKNHDPLVHALIFKTDFVVKAEVNPEHTVDFELLRS